MKKKEVRKLRLSRETLLDLERGEMQKVVGGHSTMTGACRPTSGDDGSDCISGGEAC